MKKIEIAPGIKENAPTSIHINSVMGEFLILLGLSAIVDKTFKRNKVLGTAIGLSAMAVGLKITIHNIDKQIPQELTFPPTNAGH